MILVIFKTSLNKIIKERHENLGKHKDLEKYENIQFETVLLESAFNDISQSYIIRKLITKKKKKNINQI